MVKQNRMPPWSRSVRVLVLAAAAVSGAVYVAISCRWPLMCDSPIMHYVIFLLRHGFAPYSQISDNNLPGSYLTESWAMHVFGGGDLGWRIYEYFLLLTLTAALAVVARTVDWMAGVYAGGLFLLMHAAEGPNYAVEREEVLTVLLVLGYAALFEAVRRRWPVLMLPFGFCAALALSIKPTMAPLGLVLLLMAALVLRRRGTALASYLGWTLAGAGAITLLEARFLVHYGAVQNFFFVLRKITPTYVGMAGPGGKVLLETVLPKTMLPLFFLGVLCLFLNYRAVSAAQAAPAPLRRLPLVSEPSQGPRRSAERWNWERWALLVGVFFGMVSYFVQGKGFNHHRYFYFTCLFLLLGMELMIGLRRRGPACGTAVAAIALTFLVMAPRYLSMSHKQPPNSVFTLTLEQDLRDLGGGGQAQSALQGKVQCFDLVYGCLNALYHLQLVENTGFTGDLLFFAPQDSLGRRFYRREFWDWARQDPATILVVSNEWFGAGDTFHKLDTWPEFQRYLADNYTEVLSRSFPVGETAALSSHGVRGEAAAGDDSSGGPSYRLYVRDGSPLLARSLGQRAGS